MIMGVTGGKLPKGKTWVEKVSLKMFPKGCHKGSISYVERKRVRG